MADGNKANKIAAIALVLMVVGFVALFVVLRNSKTTSAHVGFDNGMDGAVKVEVDGKPVVTVPAHAGMMADVEVGKHKVKVLDDKDKTVEEVDIEVPAAQGITTHTFAYNVARRNKYMTRYLAYGNASPEPSAPVGDNTTFFEMPSARAVFLPAESAAQKGKGGTTLPVVGHVPVHKDFPCCANLRALMDDTKK